MGAGIRDVHSGGRIGARALRAACLLAPLLGALLPGRATPGADLIVRDVHGKTVRPLSQVPGRRATCLLFIAHDCPISNGYAPEIGRIVRGYAPRGVGFYVVYTESDLSSADAAKHARDFGYPCAALLDPKHVLVRRAGATITPEAAVFNRDGKLLYRGRIDDLYVDFGKQRSEPTRRDLRLALDSALAGANLEKPVKPVLTRSIGCFIPDLP